MTTEPRHSSPPFPADSTGASGADPMSPAVHRIGTLLYIVGTFGLLGLGLLLVPAERLRWVAIPDRVVVASLGAPAEGALDSTGTRHIYGQRWEDVLTVQGWWHARDRFGQMERARLIASGGLAELIGPQALPGDRLMRALDLPEIARRQLAALTPDARSRLDAYVAGVNAWLTSPRFRPPPEWVGTGHTPEPWTAEDSALLLALYELSASPGWGQTAAAGWLAARFGAERAAALLPPEVSLPVPDAGSDRPAGDADLDEEDWRALEAADRLVGRLAGRTPLAAGGNAWAAGGDRVPEGGALLAFDRHEVARIPSRWMPMGLHLPGHGLSGLTLPGVPGVWMGHTASFAWALAGDRTDAMSVRLEPLDRNEPARQRQGRSRILPQEVPAGSPASERLRVLVEWELYEHAPQRLAGLLDLLEARRPDEVEGAIARLSGPGEYPVYADTSGLVLFPGSSDSRERLEERLADAGLLLDAATMASIQLDTVSPAARRLLERLRRLPSSGPAMDRGLAELMGWNGDMSREQPARLYRAFRDNFIRHLLAPHLGEETEEGVRLLLRAGADTGIEPVMARCLDYATAWWWHSPAPPSGGGPVELEMIWEQALAAIGAVRAPGAGADRLLMVTFQPEVGYPWLPRRLRQAGPVAVTGDRSSLQTLSGPGGGTAGEPAVDVFRQVVRLHHRTQAWQVLAPGTSGHFLDPRYDDQLTDWVRGHLRPAAVRWADAVEAGLETVRFEPAPAQRR